MDFTKIFHNKTAFERDYLQQRMDQYGFKNMSRMELFLWDLELFLQIQKRLGEHIVLKGGAATQFYLRIEAQRTSVDIDMIFCGKDEDVMMLTTYQLDELDIEAVRKKYLQRAEKEWYDRKNTEYDLEEIIADVRKQLFRYSMADSGEDVELKKYINDFKALYLNRKVEFSHQIVACGASSVHLMYEAMLNDDNWDTVRKALAIENLLELKQYEGREKGSKTKEIREMLICEFESYSTIPGSVLKGKNLKRIFWAIVDKDNLDEIREKVLVYTKMSAV